MVNWFRDELHGLAVYVLTAVPGDDPDPKGEMPRGVYLSGAGRVLGTDYTDWAICALFVLCGRLGVPHRKKVWHTCAGGVLYCKGGVGKWILKKGYP